MTFAVKNQRKSNLIQSEEKNVIKDKFLDGEIKKGSPQTRTPTERETDRQTDRQTEARLETMHHSH